MAGVSTEAKRKSAVSFLQPWQPVTIPPDGSMTGADRQSVIWTYAGILASAVAVAAMATGYVTAAFVGRVAGIAFAGKRAGIAFVGKKGGASFTGG